MVLVVYVVLLGAAGWLVMHMPTGFIPKLDRGIVTVSLQLPPGASLQRTDAVVRRANKIVLETPGVAHTSTYTGRSGSTGSNSSNLGLMYAVLDDPRERAAKGLTIDKIADDITGRLATSRKRRPRSPSRRRCAAWAGSGFSMRLQDRASMTPAQFAKVAKDFIAAANQAPGIRNVFTTFSTGTPQIFVDVDRDKAQMLKVPLEAIFEAMRVYMGSAYVNDFNMFGRTYRVTAQADATSACSPRTSRASACATSRGRWCRSAASSLSAMIAGPDRVPRYNLFPTVEVNGSAQAGVSSGQALADHGGSCQEPSCPKASPTNGPTCRTRRRRSAARATTSSRCR